MAVFAVIGSANPEAVKKAVVRQYGASHYEFASNMWFISDTGTTKDIADKLGITASEDGTLGVVLQVGAYSGRATGTAWTWLQQFPEARPNG
jgi:hypothetical protein